jgi:formylglycine-generating enzyme required for sulfatase activity
VARIFLCHASEDKVQVRAVYHRLRAIAGFEPWLDEEDLLPGQDWTREIPRALQTSDFILVFLSRGSVAKRGYVQREMKLALDALQEFPEGTIHTIPVRLDDCEVPASFRQYHYANLFDPNGFDRIVRAIRSQLMQRHAILESYQRTSLAEAPAMQDTALAPSFTNSIDIEFVLIPAGTFMIGSPDSDAEATFDEKPAHRVTISQPFYLGKYPVTQAQWAAVMGNKSQSRSNPNHPVVFVSWGDVQVFLGKLNEQEGSGDYHLPTEAQWEYACRAGTATFRYHPDVNAIAWYDANSGGDLRPVGQKLPNAWGLYDMLGNVWEWCYDGRRTYTADAVVAPWGPTGAGVRPIARGGCWGESTEHARAACRVSFNHDMRIEFVGFRCACSGPSNRI